jgi:hypothetical protein
MEEKVCTLCKICKNVSEFIKRNKKNPSSWCRECYRNYVREKGYGKYSYPGRAKKAIEFQRKLRKTKKNKKYGKVCEGNCGMHDVLRNVSCTDTLDIQ